MKKIAKIIDGDVIKYPYTLEDIKKDNPYTAFPDIFPLGMSEEDLTNFNCVLVEPSEKDIIDPIKEKLVEKTPIKKNGLS